MSEAKNKMSIIERIRTRIGESALYGGKAVCDSPCRFISLTKTRQALRLAFGTICAQIVTANSTKNTTGKGKIMENTLRGIENCGQFSMIADLWKKVQRAAGNTARIITATNNKESSYGQTIGSRLNQIAEITRSSRVMTNYIKKAIFRAKENTINNKESSYGQTIGSRLNQLAEITRSSRVMTNYIMNVTFNGGYNA